MDKDQTIETPRDTKYALAELGAIVEFIKTGKAGSTIDGFVTTLYSIKELKEIKELMGMD